MKNQYSDSQRLDYLMQLINTVGTNGLLQKIEWGINDPMSRLTIDNAMARDEIRAENAHPHEWITSDEWVDLIGDSWYLKRKSVNHFLTKTYFTAERKAQI